MRALATQETKIGSTYDDAVVPRQTVSSSGCPMGALERRVVDAIDGQTSLAMLSLKLELAPVELSHVLARLVELGAVEIAEAEAVEFDEGWDKPSGTTPKAVSTIPPVTKPFNE